MSNARRWFTSDQHFGHRNIIRFCNRPFVSIDDMDTELIKKWNEKIGENDEVFVLGDLAWREPSRYLKALKGKLHLITGNHDHKQTRKLPRWQSVQSFLELKDEKVGLIVLCHYPLQVWARSHFGTWHLHGHSHGSLRPLPGYRLDVGVDTHDFYPYNYDDIKIKMSNMQLRAIDHHTPPDEEKEKDRE